jgi:protein SCO1/2
VIRRSTPLERCLQRLGLAAVLTAAVVAGARADISFHSPGVTNDNSVPSAQMPGVLRDVGFDQRLGEQVPLDLVFHDEGGKDVRLADLMHGKPAVLSLVYYECPMLCTMVLNGLTSCMQMVKFDVGKEFDVITVSFDPRDTPEIAAKKKAGYVQRYRREGAAAGWHFLTGSEESIRSLTKACGFRYKWDEKSNQFVHASGIMVLTPDGHLSRYFYGVEYPPKDLRLGLVEAANGKIGNVADQVLLYCFHYDPATGKYGAAVIAILRLAAGMTLVGLAALLLLMRRRGRRTMVTVRT